MVPAACALLLGLLASTGRTRRILPRLVAPDEVVTGQGSLVEQGVRGGEFLIKPGKGSSVTLKIADLQPDCELEWSQVQGVATLQLGGKCKSKLSSLKYGFRLIRQGATHFSSTPSKEVSVAKKIKLLKQHRLFKFNKLDVNRRFALEVLDFSASMSNPSTSYYFLYVPGAKHCGRSKYSQKQLQCSRLPKKQTDELYGTLLSKFQMTSKRAWAVELEGVLRRPPLDTLPKAAVGRWAKFDKKYNGSVRKLIETYFKNGTWAESMEQLVKHDERKHYQKIVEGFYMPALKECMKNVVGPTLNKDKPCVGSGACGIAGFCATAEGKERTAKGGAKGVCKPRADCKDDGTGAPCPPSLTKDWQWDFDASVMPMSINDTSDPTEWDGVPVEVIAPGPPNSWPLRWEPGLRNAAEMLTVLRWMGLQMGPSTGMHVHVNIQSKIAGGECCLTDKQAIRIWTAFAKYQLVLDETQSSSRVPNAYAVGLMMGDARMAAIFANIHDFWNGIIHHKKADGSPDFCNSALGVIRDPKTLAFKAIGGAWDTPSGKNDTTPNGKVCQAGHPDERYTALNLHPVGKKGTIEFRCHAGTHDPERILRWVQLVTAFVESFKDDAELDRYYDEALIVDWRQLFLDQLKVTRAELFDTLSKRSNLDPGSMEYLRKHSWEGKCPMMDQPVLPEVTVNRGYQPSPLIRDLNAA